MNNENYIPWDSAGLLTDDEAIIEYLKAALEEGDPAFFMKAVGNVARAKGMTTIAQETQLGRPSLYKALSGERRFRRLKAPELMKDVYLRAVYKDGIVTEPTRRRSLPDHFYIHIDVTSRCSRKVNLYKPSDLIFDSRY